VSAQNVALYPTTRGGLPIIGRQVDRVGRGQQGGPGNDKIAQQILAKKEDLVYFSSIVVFLILASLREIA